MYKRSPKKEEEQKLRILNSLTTHFQTATDICKKSNLLIGRGKELLNILEKENKVERALRKSKIYSYWRLPQTQKADTLSLPSIKEGTSESQEEGDNRTSSGTSKLLSSDNIKEVKE